MGFADKNDFESSVFNIAVRYLEDLRVYLNMADNANVEGDYISWFSYLKIIYSRISPALKDKEERKPLEDQIDKLAEKMGEFTKSDRNGEVIIHGDIRTHFERLDWDLKIIANDKGMFLTSTGDPTKVMLRM